MRTLSVFATVLFCFMTQADANEVPRECFDIRDDILVAVKGRFSADSNDICSYWTRRNHVRIPEGVRGIASNTGLGVFATLNLTRVTLPKTLEFIGKDTFAHNDIAEIKLPAGLKHIGERAFVHNNISNLKLNSGLNYIGDSAFEDNKIEGELVFPKGLQHLGADSFSGNNLQNIFFLGESLVEIDKGAFSGNRLQRLTLPNGLEKIGFRAFSGNILAQVVLPESLIEIGGAAFIGSSVGTMENYPRNHFTHLVIPKNVRSIGGYAFEWVGIEELVVEGNNLEVVKSHAFSNNRIEELILPNSLLRIGEKAFHYNGIQRLVLPSKLEYLGRNSFAWNHLGEFDLRLPSSLVEMCESSFYRTRVQDSIMVPDSARVRTCGPFWRDPASEI